MKVSLGLLRLRLPRASAPTVRRVLRLRRSKLLRLCDMGFLLIEGRAQGKI